MIQILLIALGVLILGMGIKCFTPLGVEVRAGKRVTGNAAKVIGAFVLLAGAFTLLFAFYGLNRIFP